MAGEPPKIVPTKIRKRLEMLVMEVKDTLEVLLSLEEIYSFPVNRRLSIPESTVRKKECPKSSVYGMHIKIWHTGYRISIPCVY